MRLPFLPWHELPRLLRDLDVNLAPLAPGSRFNEAKSAIKWLEAALVETPTVASPTQPFREAIEHGVNGLLADGPDEWVERPRPLLLDDQPAPGIGRRARAGRPPALSPTSRAAATWRSSNRDAGRPAERGRLVGRLGR